MFKVNSKNTRKKFGICSGGSYSEKNVWWESMGEFVEGRLLSRRELFKGNCLGSKSLGRNFIRGNCPGAVVQGEII